MKACFETRSIRRKSLGKLRCWAAFALLSLASIQCGGYAGADGGAELEELAIGRKAQALTAPAITPPLRTASAPVGVMPGKGSVGLDGQFKYHVPIEVPSGRAGMTPSLSLVYDSSGPDGPLGVGWSLRGLSSISRCTKIEAQNGTTDGIQFAVNDAYCLDGQRLVLVAGTHGTNDARYRTEIDTGVQLRVTDANALGPTVWELDHPDGRRAVYRLPPGHSVERTHFGISGQAWPMQAVALTWPIESEQDRSGNKISYHYFMDEGIEYPYYIDYTECASEPCEFTRSRQIYFNFVLRPASDYSERWINGARLQRRFRLETIMTLIRDAGDTPRHVQRYNISYIQSAVSGRSLIESIQLCDELSACAPETRFLWHGQYESEAQYQVLGEGSTTAYSDNLVAVSEDANTSLDYVSESGIAVYDANGDGNDDVVLKRWPETNELGQIHHGTWEEYNSRGSEDLLLLGDGAGYFEQPRVVDHDGDGTSRMDDPCGEMEIMDAGSAIPVDLDGDGIQELVAHVGTGCPFTFFGHRNAPGYPNLIATEHQMAVFGWDEASRSLRQRAVPAIDELRYSSQLQFVDLNGDRLPELATTDKAMYQHWRVFRALLYTQSPADLPQVNYAAAPFDTFLLGPESAWWKRRPVSHQVVDEDGDGRQDLVQTALNSVQRIYRWSALGVLGGNAVTAAEFLAHDIENPTSILSSSDASAPVDPNWGAFGPTYPHGTTGLWYRVDVNGDGLKDALYRQSSPTVAWKLRTNTGTGYTSPRDAAPATNALTSYFADEIFLNGDWIRGLDIGMRFADMNGDGREDLILMGDPAAYQEVHGSGYTVSWNAPRVLYSDGNVFLPEVSLPITQCRRAFKPDQRWPMTAIGDVDGNGLADIVDLCVPNGTPYGRQLITYSLRALPAGTDVIREVMDERGLAALIRYDSLSDGSGLRFGDVHLSPTHYRARIEDCVYPAACSAKGRAVREYSDYRSVHDSTTSYKYRGARVDVQGRGWLGFETVEMRDQLTGRSSTYTLDQEATERVLGHVRLYPHAGEPVRLYRGLPDTDSSYLDALVPSGGLSTETTSWGRQLQAGYPIVPRRESFETRIHQGQLLRRSYSTRVEFDDPEFPLPSLAAHQTTDHDTGIETTNETSIEYYPHDTTEWLIGRPSRTTHVSSTNGDAYAEGCTTDPCSESSLTVDYTYVPGTRLISSTIQTHDGEILITRNTYGAGGLLTLQRLEGSGETRDTELSYDASGSYVEGVKNPLGHETWSLRNPATGQTFAAIDENGVQTLIVRDGFGRITRVQGQDGSQFDYSYATGQISEASLGGGSSSTTFDSRARPRVRQWSTFDGGSGSLRTTYSAVGQPRLVEYSTGSSYTQLAKMDYDRLGRPVLRVNGLDEYTQYRYDDVLGVIEVTDPKGIRTLTKTDVHGNLAHITHFSTLPTAEEVQTGYRYNELGQLSAVVPGDLASGAIERMRYDALGRQVSWTTDNLLRRGTTYNAFSDAELVEHDGLLIDHVFDKLGRLTTRSELGTAETQSYVWDQGLGALGRISSAIGATGHQTVFQYDPLGRLQEQREVFASGESLSFGYTYDAHGRLDVLRYPESAEGNDTFAHTSTGGLRVQYQYQNGQLLSITELGAGGPPLWQANQRHVFGMVTQQQDHAGVVTASAYHPNTLRLQGKAVSGVTSGTAPDQLYSYEINGRLQGAVTGNGAVNEVFSYTGFDQLTRYHRDGSFGLLDVDYSYRPSGDLQRIQTPAGVDTYSFLEPDKSVLTRRDSGSLRFEYENDDAGRVERFVRRTQAGAIQNERTYAYNSFNLPSSITNAGLLFTFAYDAFGSRAMKNRGGTSRALYVGDLYEERSVDQVINESVFRVQSDEGVVAEITKSWSGGAVTRRMFHTDLNGSVIGETIGTASQLTGGFAPFGPRQGPAPAQTLSNYGYTGHNADYDLMLINMRGRIYDTVQRRFLTRDPVLDNPYDVGGTGPYTYVRNNPANLTDPTGFQMSGEAPSSTDALVREQQQSESRNIGDFESRAHSEAMQQSAPQMGMNNSMSGIGPSIEQGRMAQSMSFAPGGPSGPTSMGSGPEGGPPTMNGIVIQPLRSGEYGPPMSREMYLHMMDQPLGGTAQMDDLLSIIPGVGLGKALVIKGGRVVAPKAAGLVDDAVRATTPVGRRGAPMAVARGTNAPTMIGGRNFTGHALDQMQSRGFVPAVVENAIQHGARSAGNQPGTIQHVFEGLRVITNEAGGVITVIPR